jgi:hypothetical protein
MKRDEYLKRRGEFVPEDPKDIKLIIVAESPPASELYFYKPDGRVKEPLFAAMMKQLDFKCSKKLDGLQHFKQRGLVLVDATYEPVDGLSDSVRTAIIERDYELLCCDLRSLTPDRSARLVLIKANVCQIVEPMLQDEFKVLNRGTVITFPSMAGRIQGVTVENLSPSSLLPLCPVSCRARKLRDSGGRIQLWVNQRHQPSQPPWKNLLQHRCAAI